MSFNSLLSRLGFDEISISDVASTNSGFSLSSQLSRSSVSPVLRSPPFSSPTDDNVVPHPILSKAPEQVTKGGDDLRCAPQCSPSSALMSTTPTYESESASGMPTLPKETHLSASAPQVYPSLLKPIHGTPVDAKIR